MERPTDGPQTPQDWLQRQRERGGQGWVDREREVGRETLGARRRDGLVEPKLNFPYFGDTQ